VLGRMPDEVLPWEGSMQALYSDEHSDLDGEGYGLKYETAPVHPSLMAACYVRRGRYGSVRSHAERASLCSR